MSEENKFQEWALVELLGRQRVAGRVTEQTIAGHGFIRVDIPAPAIPTEFTTRFFSPSAIYAISPVSEEVARQLAGNIDAAPVKRWELPAPEHEDDPDADEPIL